MKNEWYTFQETIKEYFLSLGLYAETNKTITGIRTEHDIDIYVDFSFIGLKTIWLIEAKYWNQKVDKNTVSAFMHRVSETCADKGIIVSRKGFQTCAFEAVENSNILLRTFEELKKETEHYTLSNILCSYENRFNILEARYWSHSKQIRQKYNLRGYIENDTEFSGFVLLCKIRTVIENIKTVAYPINLTIPQLTQVGEIQANNLQQAINWLNLSLNLLDERLILAEIEMQKNNDFSPKLDYPIISIIEPIYKYIKLYD